MQKRIYISLILQGFKRIQRFRRDGKHYSTKHEVGKVGYPQAVIAEWRRKKEEEGYEHRHATERDCHD